MPSIIEVTEGPAASRNGDRAALDPRKSRIVELRYFGGLSVEETAQVVGAAPITVKREWARARAWLHRELEPETAG